MEKQSYENSRGITLGITTFGAKCFSPEASCRSHTLETIWILCKTRQEWQFPSQRLRFFSSAPRFREQGRNQMSLSQCLLSLHMFRNRYWPCTHTHAYNKTETRIFCFRSFISSKVTANWNRVGSKYVILGSHARNSNENGEQDNDAARSLHVFIHDSNPESSFSLIRGSEASDQFRSPKRQSSLKMYVPLSLFLKPINIEHGTG